MGGGIQPVWPLGRPGSRTRSQAPFAALPSTGRTVRTLVSGRREETASIRSELASGRTWAVCEASRTTSGRSAGGFSAAVAEALPAPTRPTASSGKAHRETPRRMPEGRVKRCSGLVIR